MKLYATKSVPGVNYEYLFLTYDLTLGKGSDPASNSLFCLDNFKALVTAGLNTPNILKNPELTYGIDFDLGDDWYAISTALGGLNNMQTYLIWLWLDTAYDMTF